MNVVEVKDVSKRFYSNQVLSNISFSVSQGTFTALLGQNGSGKSTLLNIIMGLVKMDEGECFVFGESLRSHPDHLKAKIGYVSEKILFDYPETMNSFFEMYSKLFPKFSLIEFTQLTKDLNIDLTKKFNDYSRGQKMQIALVSALSQKPELILIDEVTSVLDAFSRQYLLSKLDGYVKSGGTVILTTNIVSEIQYLATDVVFLSDSHVKFSCKVSEVPLRFKKIRVDEMMASQLNSSECIWVGKNNDGSETFIVPEDSLKDLKLDFVPDRRQVNLEELYIYHSQSHNL